MRLEVRTDSQSVLPTEISIPTTKRQSSNASVIDSTANSSKTILCGFDVDVFPDGSTFCCDGLGFLINSDFAHLGEIDHEALLDGGGAGCGVPASTNGEGDLMVLAEGEYCGDVVWGRDEDYGGLWQMSVFEMTDTNESSEKVKTEQLHEGRKEIEMIIDEGFAYCSLGTMLAPSFDTLLVLLAVARKQYLRSSAFQQQLE